MGKRVEFCRKHKEELNITKKEGGKVAVHIKAHINSLPGARRTAAVPKRWVFDCAMIQKNLRTQPSGCFETILTYYVF